MIAATGGLLAGPRWLVLRNEALGAVNILATAPVLSKKHRSQHVQRRGGWGRGGRPQLSASKRLTGRRVQRCLTSFFYRPTKTMLRRSFKPAVISRPPLPSRTSHAAAQRIDRRRERRQGLAAAGIAGVIPGKRAAPPFQHAAEAAVSDLRLFGACFVAGVACLCGPWAASADA